MAIAAALSAGGAIGKGFEFAPNKWAAYPITAHSENDNNEVGSFISSRLVSVTALGMSEP